MGKLRVFYDYQAVCMQTFGGVSRYYFDLINAIERNNLARVEMKALLSINAYFGDYFKKKPLKYRKGLGRIIRPVNEIYMRLCLSRNKYDIICPTYYAGYVPKKHTAKVVLTVHDMTHELLPEYFPESDRTVELKKKRIYEADYIIAVSENTKRDIMAIYPDIAEDKIGVVYHGCSFEKKVSNGKINGFPERYILYVGGRNGYKNFNRFVEAVKPILTENPELFVVCIGSGAFRSDELDAIAEFKDRVKQFDVTDEILTYAYSHALCFVYPSLYEGFGLTILEAFVCDCPVVASNTSSLPEVGGNAAEYFLPDSVEDMTQTINRVIGSEQLRQRMIELGREQLKKFSWDKAARQTVECFQRAIEG